VRCFSIRWCHVEIFHDIFMVVPDTLTQQSPSSQLDRHRHPSWLNSKGC
jgi:hypothetical protein